MPPTFRYTHCKYEGCTAPRHVWPNGKTCNYCTAHIRHRRTKQRDGHEPMTGVMQGVLEHLVAMKAQGDVFVPLYYPLAHGITLKKLIERGYIFKSPGLDGIRYTISESGESALKDFQQFVNRRDGICPACGVCPRHVRSSGIRDAYCIKCLRAESKAERDAGIQYVNPDRPCSRCHDKPLYQFPGGLYSSYCEDCTRIVRRLNARKHRREQYLRYKADGTLPICKRCKDEPVLVFPNSLAELCHECYLTSIRRTKLNKAFRGVMGIRPGPLKPRKIHAPARPDEQIAARQVQQTLRLDYVPNDAIVKIMRAMRQEQTS